MDKPVLYCHKKGEDDEKFIEPEAMNDFCANIKQALQNLCKAADNGHVANYSNLWDEARTALAKATGESK